VSVDVVHRPESRSEFALKMSVGIGMRMDSAHPLHSVSRATHSHTSDLASHYL